MGWVHSIVSVLDRIGVFSDASVDAVVTTMAPPSGVGLEDIVGFFSSESVEVWRECFRVLKPGAHLLCFAGTAWDLVSLGIRAAGFENRDTIAGIGTPAWEPILVFRKPLSGTVAENVLEHGTGVLNIDGARVSTKDNLDGGAYASSGGRQDSVAAAGMMAAGKTVGVEFEQPKGRWPTNVIFIHHAECVLAGVKKVAGIVAGNTSAVRRSGVHSEAKGHQTIGREQPVTHYADAEGKETVADWQCHPTCSVKILDGQSGELKNGGHLRASATQKIDNDIYNSGFTRVQDTNFAGDSGGAYRYFPQFEPRTDLMSWLTTLVCPEGGMVVDPWGGG